MTFMKALPAVAVTLAVSVTFAAAQTAVKPPKNRFTPQQDVELGREAAAEVRAAVPDHQRRANRQLSHRRWAIGWSPPRRRSSSSRSTSTRSRR